jgi:putative SOS response-associated peptidase YedK
MCGRFAASATVDQLIDFFEIDQVVGQPAAPSYNVAPTNQVNVVLERLVESGRQRLLTAASWGLVPAWAKDRKAASRLINARAETVAEKPSFRRAFAARRCLIPADGYYEWAAMNVGAGGRQPYFLRAADGMRLAMAGLYENWKTPDGDWLTSVTVITTAAVDQIRTVHDRMPLVVTREHWDRWLDPQLTADFGAMVGLVELEFFPVSKLVNSVGNNDAGLIVAQSAKPVE